MRRSARILDVEIDADAAERDRPRARAARRGSRTGSSAASATSPRCATRARHDGDRRGGARAARGRRRGPRAVRPRAPARDRREVRRRARSASRRSPSRSARSPTRSRTSTSRILLQLGFLQRTPRGRVVTDLGRAHLGVAAACRRSSRLAHVDHRSSRRRRGRLRRRYRHLRPETRLRGPVRAPRRSGAGRGWAGIVEVARERRPRSPRAADAPARSGRHGGKELVFGPYYARAAAIVPVAERPRRRLRLRGRRARGAPTRPAVGCDARRRGGRSGRAGQAARRRARAARSGPRALAASAGPRRRRDARGRRASRRERSPASSGGLPDDGDRLALVERGWALKAPRETSRPRCAACSSATLPVLRPGRRARAASRRRSPGPGIRSYYLLELTGAARGVLFVAHTDAAPRGFTLLCRRLGVRLAAVASTQLGVALTRTWCSAEAARLHAAFGQLDLA